MYRPILLTLFLCLGWLFPHCNDPGLDCGSFNVPGFFDVQGLRLSNFKSIDGEHFAPQVPNALVGVDQYALELHFDVDYVAQVGTQWGWMQSAVACSPLPPGSEGAKTERWEKLDIITRDTFDAEHLPGSSLADVVEVIDRFAYETQWFDTEFQPMHEFLSLRKGDLLMREAYTFRLTKAPEAGRIFKVDVVVAFEGGERYTLENQRMNIY